MASQTLLANPADVVQQARDNATLRDQFIARGLATASQMDAVGYVSHNQLDLWEAADALEDGVLGLQEAWGLGLLKGAAFDLKIHRGNHGRFGFGTGAPRLKTVEGRGGKAIKTLEGTRGGVKGKTFQVFKTPKLSRKRLISGSPAPASAAQIRHDAEALGSTPEKIAAAGDKRMARMAVEARKRGRAATKRGEHEMAAQLNIEADKLEQGRGDPEQRHLHGVKELYSTRSADLNKRIDKSLGKAADRGEIPRTGEPNLATPSKSSPIRRKGSPNELSQAETNLNDAGRVSQRTLLTYANEASSVPTTVERYRNPDGSYHSSRARLHARIIDGLLRQRNPDGSISFTNPYLKKPKKGKSPTVIFTGGGYAAGKGKMLKLIKAKGQWPKDAMLIDPDVIKAALPEFQQALESHPDANLSVYQEAWDIAQAAVAKGQKRKLNVVVDGISDTSAEEVAQRVKSFTDKGYVLPRIFYVSKPTDEAIKDATARAEGAKVAANRRMIPESIMRSVHRDVSATIPQVMNRSKELGLHVQVYNAAGRDPVTGKGATPTLVSEALPTGDVTHHDAAAMQTILNKANEAIPALGEEPLLGDRPMPTTFEQGAAGEKGTVAKAVLGDFKDTEDKWADTDENGNIIYDPQRHQDVHAKYVDEGLRVRQENENGELIRDPKGDYIQPQDEKRALFTAGGPASGKGTALRTIPGMNDQVKQMVTVDPDEAKPYEPEYQAMAQVRDGYAGNGAHEESSHMSKELLQDAYDKGLGIFYDSAGDSGPGKFLKKLSRANEEGYDVHLMLADASTDVALERAANRAEETGRAFEPGRLLDYHQQVSQAFPSYANQDWVSFQAYNTETKPPTLFASKEKGETAVTIHDLDYFRAFLSKGGLTPEDIQTVLANAVGTS